MAFTTRRGRPRSHGSGNDLGTPELILKRAYGVTSEPLDLCLERGIITKAQHWAGIHFRWLYTVRHGTPTIRALDPLHFGGRELRPENEHWKKEREAEYHTAARLLHARGLLKPVADICIYSIAPVYLRPRGRQTGAGEEGYVQLQKLRDALDLLDALWQTPKPN